MDFSIGRRRLKWISSIVRASLGAMSTKRDVDEFVEFLQVTFIKASKGSPPLTTTPTLYYSSPVNHTLDLHDDQSAHFKTSSEKGGVSARGRRFTDVRELPRPQRTIPYHPATPPPTTNDDMQQHVPRQFPMPLPEVVYSACPAVR